MASTMALRGDAPLAGFHDQFAPTITGEVGNVGSERPKPRDPPRSRKDDMDMRKSRVRHACGHVLDEKRRYIKAVDQLASEVPRKLERGMQRSRFFGQRRVGAQRLGIARKLALCGFDQCPHTEQMIGRVVR